MSQRTQPRKAVPHLLTVINNTLMTPNMRRLTFSGAQLARFPDISTSHYVKLLFDFDGQPITTAEMSPDDALMRTYTVRAINQAEQTMCIDVVMHSKNTDCDEHSGPASRWAERAKTGDRIAVAGPGSSKGLAQARDWVLFIGDMTALPAISAYLETLSPDSTGYAVIEVISDKDKQILKKPDGVQIIWIEQGSGTLQQHVEMLSWLPGAPAVWIACEFSQMRALRKLMTNHYALPHQQLYVSSYWRKGRSEDQHKIDKQNDANAYALSQHAESQ